MLKVRPSPAALNGRFDEAGKEVGSFSMNRFMCVFAVSSVVAAASFAAALRGDLSALDGYSESLGMTLSYSDREFLNSSNCYDACAVIWGSYFSDATAAPRAASH